MKEARTSETVTCTPGDSPDGLNERAFRTLLRLRWGLIAGELLAVVFTAKAVSQHVHLAPVAAVIVLQVLSNLFPRMGRDRERLFARPSALAALLAADIVCLTAVIHWSGGPANPFSSLFVIHALVAVFVLPARQGMLLAGMAGLGYLAVFLLATGGSIRASALDHVGASMHQSVAGHLLGMWISLALTIASVTLFGGQLLRQLREKEQALARAVSDAAEAKRVASLTSFAAGAAHELSTPLSTIAVVAGELLRRPASQDLDGAVTRDLELIRAEIARCRRIIQSLHYDLDHSTTPCGASFQREMCDALTLLLGEQAMARVRVTAETDSVADGIPVRGLAQAAAALIRNALEASEPDQAVRLRIREIGGRLEMSILDHGRGITAEDLPRVQEPFFSRRPGGTGLGLFLARVICNQLGAALTLRSEPGLGTEAKIVVPRMRAA